MRRLLLPIVAALVVGAVAYSAGAMGRISPKVEAGRRSRGRR